MEWLQSGIVRFELLLDVVGKSIAHTVAVSAEHIELGPERATAELKQRDTLLTDVVNKVVANASESKRKIASGSERSTTADRSLLDSIASGETASSSLCDSKRPAATVQQSAPKLSAAANNEPAVASAPELSTAAFSDASPASGESKAESVPTPPAAAMSDSADSLTKRLVEAEQQIHALQASLRSKEELIAQLKAQHTAALATRDAKQKELMAKLKEHEAAIGRADNQAKEQQSRNKELESNAQRKEAELKRVQDKAKEAEKKAAQQVAQHRSDFDAAEVRFKDILREKDQALKEAEAKLAQAQQQQEPIAALKAQHQRALEELKAQHREVEEDFAAMTKSKLALNNVVSGLQSELHDKRARIAQLTGKDFSGECSRASLSSEALVVQSCNQARNWLRCKQIY